MTSLLDSFLLITLTDSDTIASYLYRWLLHEYKFLNFVKITPQIVPMINPDGVIVGNTRCSLAGRDLNRQYKSVIKEAFPPVYHVKQMIRKLQEC